MSFQTAKWNSCIIGLLVLAATAFSITAAAQEEPKARLVDSYSYVNSEESSFRIDMWRNELTKSPLDTGVIIVYGGATSKRGEVDAHIRGIRESFALKGIKLNQFRLVKGGYREKQTIEFWVIPIGAEMPLPTPTVDVKKVKFKGVTPRRYPYECCG